MELYYNEMSAIIWLNSCLITLTDHDARGVATVDGDHFKQDVSAFDWDVIDAGHSFMVLAWTGENLLFTNSSGTYLCNLCGPNSTLLGQYSMQDVFKINFILSSSF